MTQRHSDQLAPRSLCRLRVSVSPTQARVLRVMLCGSSIQEPAAPTYTQSLLAVSLLSRQQWPLLLRRHCRWCRAPCSQEHFLV